MNNSQFRRLILDKPSTSSSSSTPTRDQNGPSPSSSRPSMTPMLGSRARSSIPMTPRSVSGPHNASNDFARQLAEHKRDADGQPAATKKFRSSAAPKGTRLARGYQDRTSLRRVEGDAGTTMQDDKEKRVAALEELVKLQQIDRATFEKLRAEIGVGGDVASTHLVKGLDWRLLERVRKGEDVDVEATPASGKEGKVGEEEQEEEEERRDVDDELENVLDKEVEAVQREERVKKGEMAPPSLEALDAQTLSRDEILKRLKASRAAMAQTQPPPTPAPEPSLGARFKKVGSGDKSEKKRFIENVNGRRREVLVTTDRDGKTKRKVKWLDTEVPGEPSKTADTVSIPLGMDVPAELLAKQQALLDQQKADEEDDDDDIFEGVGADYDPLAGIADDSEDGSASDGEDKPSVLQSSSVLPNVGDAAAVSKSRNYFSTIDTTETQDAKANPLTTDPTILAALKRAAALRKSQESADTAHDATDADAADDGDPDRVLRRKEFLESLKKRDRDDAGDMDLGFGESRFGDEEDEDGPLWEGDEAEKKGGGARKRGRKKRKGDKDNVKDVLGVMEGRKKDAK